MRLRSSQESPVLLPGSELPAERIAIHVDGKRPLAGERSRFTVSPNGNVFFTYTLTAGDFECKPLGTIAPTGEIQMSAIDSESTWNVEGWGTFGFPFDLACDSSGKLHAAARHRGQPYGVDYWYQTPEGRWQLESFGENVTYGGNNVALKLLPDGQPVVVCLDKNRTHLTVWERGEDGQWTATRPAELFNVASGDFDLEVGTDAALQVVYCAMRGGPVCATRGADRKWTKQLIAPVGFAQMIASTRDTQGKLHVSFASGEQADEVRTLSYASQLADGSWQTEPPIAKADSTRHVGRTDIAAAGGRIAVAWEHGIGPRFAPKDYGAKVGAVRLTLIANGNVETQELAASGGRPGLALSKEGNTAWVGVYSGNEDGDDFHLWNVRLDGGKPLPTQVTNGAADAMFRDGCLRDIDSGDANAQLRGLQRIDMSGLPQQQRQTLIRRFLNHDDPQIRVSMVRELAKSPDTVVHFEDQLGAVLADSNRLVRKTFLEGLGAAKIQQNLARRVFDEAIASEDPMTRLTAAEVLRQHPSWVSPNGWESALKHLGLALGHQDTKVSGSAAMSLERMIELPGTRELLHSVHQAGTPLQRVRAALVLFRCGQEIRLLHLAKVPQQGDQQAQLALCGLLGQLRTAESVPLLEQLLRSGHPRVRTAAVFALRSVALVAELKPVAKHPHGFDILALRAVEPATAELRTTQQAAVDALIGSLKHTDPNVRQKACDALNRVRATTAASALEPLLADADAGVRIAARTALGLLRNQPTAEILVDHANWQAESKDREVHQLTAVHRPPTSVKQGVVDAASDKQLLIDDFVLEEMAGLTRRLHPFEKHPRNPVFQSQVPWEEGWADPFMSTVTYDEAQRCFKMWYRCGPRHSLKGYAVSEDGIHWQRPNVAQSAWQQFQDHNLLGFEGEIATWKKPGNNVQFFPDQTGTNRFLSLFYQPPTKDYAISRSADGVNWQQPESVRDAHGDVVSLVWDPGRQKYLFFPKYNRAHDGYVRRSFSATTLPALDAPFSPSFPFLADHTDDARVADEACRAYGSLLPDTLRLRDFHSEIYSVTALPYEGVVVALYDLWAVTGSAEGPLDMPMKVSRDMNTWHTVDHPRRALSIGQFGDWDSGMVYGGNTMLVVDDQIRLYYLGANMGHCTRVLPMTKPYHALGVGLATLRLDGFASLRPTEQTGQLVTKPLTFKGQQLQINGRCMAGGSIRVEVLNAAGKPLPGFELDNCVPFSGDSLRHTIAWKTQAQIPQQAAPIRLRVVLTSADLYAFQFVSTPDAPQ